MTAPPVPPARPRNAVVADWSFRKGSPRLIAGAGGFMPTGSVLRASANEIVQHTREEAAFEFSERLDGIPRTTAEQLARDFLTKAEARQSSGLLATERTRRAAQMLRNVPADFLPQVILQSGLTGARRHMDRHLNGIQNGIPHSSPALTR